MRPSVLACSLLALSCGSPSSSGADEPFPADVPVDGTPEADVPPPVSWYRLAAAFDDGKRLDLDRDLTGAPQAFTYGSGTAAPAIVFSMNDQVYEPTYATVRVNLGFVAGSDAHPVQCPGTGTYDLGTGVPPEVYLVAYGTQYRSTVAGSTGTFRVDRWSLIPGLSMEGVVTGRILSDNGKADRFADLTLEFRFEVPERRD